MQVADPTDVRASAALARGLLTDAHEAVLHTGRASRRGRVELGDDGEGRPLVWLEGSAPAVADLAACRVATLVIDAPTSPWRLRLVVSLRMRRPDASGRRAYEPVVLSARLVGPRAVTVPVADLLRAAPDPARVSSRLLLAHLASAHMGDLLAAARQHAPEVEDVVLLGASPESPESVEGVDGVDGVVLALLGPSGVGRMVVPGPCRCG
jgi:hypothetical protein